MAEFLEVPYGAVCVASVVPALLYYAALFFHVDLEAGRQGIGGVRGEAQRRVRDILAEGWHFVVPLGFLAVVLFKPDLLGLGAGMAALVAAALQLVLSTWRGRLSFAGASHAAWGVLQLAGRASIEIIVIGGAAGILVGIVSISGLAFSITLQMVTFAGGNLAVLLVLASVLAFVLGMGMPTVSVYILTATLLAPALVKLGVSPMAAHMFVLYAGMLSMITPPVAFAAYAAAQVAGTSGWKTGWDACRVGWGVFVLPFLFVASPSLLLDADPARIAVDVARTLFGLYLVTAGVVGYRARPLSPFARIAHAALGVGALLPAAAFPGAEWMAAASVCMGAGLLFATRPPVPRPVRRESNS
jgi:TRAP transporter 4TM/12TM fusion protein